MHSNQSVNTHAFSMIPKAEIPRSSFRMQRAYKTTFGGRNGAGATPTSYIIPCFVEEILPGDTWNCRMTAFCRLATPLFPTMDNLYLDFHFFFVPNRLVWDNWKKFMGERYPTPSSSIVYQVPAISSPVGGFQPLSLYDYMGLPCVGQVAGVGQVFPNALPMRAYALIWNEWFRDQNVSSAIEFSRGDATEDSALYYLLPRFKRHDYFTGCLPFAQKGTAVSIPLGTTAPIISTGGAIPFSNVAQTRTSQLNMTTGSATPTWSDATAAATSGATFGPAGTAVTWANVNLATATAATINQLRQSFQIQRLLERDARAGTRYTEIIRSHFGVISPDARLQRPEFLGGGTIPITINPVAQTSATDSSGTQTPQGTLAAIGTGLGGRIGFTQSFTEHGYVIGLMSWRADLTYQQGLRRHWTRRTRYDYYFPVFAMLGEQAVLQKELYCLGQPGFDDLVFGYQERWAEYRYLPSEVTGYFRSTTSGTLDAWHYSQRFTAAPTLNEPFLVEAPPLERTMAVGPDASGQYFLMDAFFDIKAARPLPMYSVPGLIDHL